MNKQYISIKYKISSFLILIIIIFSIANMLITKAVLTPQYLKIEDEDAKKIAFRIKDLLRNELESIDAICRDWAFWDDSYKFMENLNRSYIFSNLRDEAFKTSDINLIAFIDKNNKLRYYKGLNLKRMKPVAFSYFQAKKFLNDNLLSSMLNNGSDVETRKVNTVIGTFMGPMIISVRLVVDSGLKKNPNGVLVVGRVFDDARIARLKKLTDIKVDIITDKSKIKQYLKDVGPEVKTENPLLIDKTPNFIRYVVSLKDINSSVAILGIVNYKRTLYQKLMLVQNYYFYILLFFIFITTAICLYFIQFFAISPVITINNQLARIKGHSNLNDFNVINRNDELGSLSFMIKNLLETIDCQQKILSKKAYVDGLTQVVNRRSFDEKLLQDFSRLQRSGSPISLILCDIDFFKKFNDNLGHQAGDQCLISIAQALLSCVGRPGDLVARYGGEEFGIILPETYIESACCVAEKIQKAVKKLKIVHPESEVNKYVTISMGIASISLVHLGDNYESLIKKADQALYQAKHNGRNRYEIYMEKN